MSLAESPAAALAAPAWRLGPGERTALVVVLAGLVSALLAPLLPWVAAWPDAWVLPVTERVGSGLGWFLDLIKPAARLVSGALAWPMAGTTWLLAEAPWPLAFGGFVALGLWVGGPWMAALTVASLGFVLASGYWTESMNTLALVAVSVPLALALGLGIGVLAFEMRRIRAALQTVLDIMQTVPTFAYLTPLLVLFGFGPVVGLIASAIYAAPPMARNVLLGLERVDPEIREAARMIGTSRWQRIVEIDIPAAMGQILVGVNQCVMAALSMVIIAAVIGGFDDIGWTVLLTMRKAWFGQALLAGMVIVVFAMLIDRMSAALAEPERRGDPRIARAVLGVSVLAGLVSWTTGIIPGAAEIDLLDPVAAYVDAGLTEFTKANGAALDQVKNTAMFYGLLPLRIGLDDAVLPFTWGFTWDRGMSAWLLGLAGAGAALMLWRGWLVAATVLLAGTAVMLVGITQLPWPAVVVAAAALGWRAGGWGLAAFAGLSFLAMAAAGLWDRAMLSIYLSGAAVLICACVGGALGLLAAVSPLAWRVLRPVCDTLQTIPLFVFLIPMLMFFQIGEFSALLAICAYAVVPMIRYTRHGIVSTPADLVEAATASGATRWQMLRDVRIPYAAPSMLLGLNQTILYAFAMLVIAALIGTTGLGQAIYIALGKADLGLGVSAGAAMALLALIADRLVQGFAAERRRALGL
ncbi:ABC transporter permease subunit [Paralimibaculum aggregatum]|uniref:ABC transporter permease subunit n=1 Tax=Paralimibaculum aggregatum TaxID=3036245 RepID=A0ABQ6LED9_9RHOB|nr:ABC transporter permease subunit [Limibaculum sp. NKW23]GMG81706.1 ABC transporter permease subunit [Limibaculum sp. NKW23]